MNPGTVADHFHIVPAGDPRSEGLTNITGRGDALRLCYGGECHLPDVPKYIPQVVVVKKGGGKAEARVEMTQIPREAAQASEIVSPARPLFAFPPLSTPTSATSPTTPPTPTRKKRPPIKSRRK